MNDVAEAARPEIGSEEVEVPTVVPVPQSQIGAAIARVMAELVRLEKADENKFARYFFTSVDDFKDAVRPLMAANGLWHETQQANFQFVEIKGDKDKVSTVAQFDFDITLCHVSGEKKPPSRMTVFLPLTGAQTSGAARSYAIKEWMKDCFLASAGAPEDIEEEADMKEQSREGMRLSKADARALFDKLTKELRETEKGKDHEAVAKWWADNREGINSLPKDWHITIRNEYAETYKRLKAEADLDSMSDEQLDALAQRESA
ncbi:MAG: hypothetical protein DI629_12325 [Mesorhizobium amorphae]|nr:MAG: hypothetical protein DI629_12325 [Mesorhizobium amorphae]